MNYNESYTVQNHFQELGFTVTLDASKTSDYVTITNDNKYGMKLVIRFSDHDAMTGRSACADLSYVISDLKDEYAGKFESKISIDEDGDISSDEVEFDTELERDSYLMNVILTEITNKIDF
jgi:hypothetical protein